MDLLILAVVAGVLLYRLNAVLGQRDKDDPAEKNALKNPFSTSDTETEKPGNIITLPGRASATRDADGIVVGRDDGPMSLENQIQLLRQADASFDEHDFLSGAKIAFTMVVEAFAKGDSQTLRPLLSDEIFQDFNDAITERNAQGHRLETVIESVDDVAITDGKIVKDVMNVTLRIVSTQNNRSFDAENIVISGDDKADEVTDFWVFSRKIAARNPNWTLIATDAG